MPGDDIDGCHKNGAILHEKFCKKIVKLPPDFTLESYPIGNDDIDCVHAFEPAGQCIDGACVQAAAEPTCDDLEGIINFEFPGTVEGTDFDGNAVTQVDHCREDCAEVCVLGVCSTECAESEETLIELSCDSAGEIPVETSHSCYNECPPKVCGDGGCVPYGGVDQRACARDEDPTNDPYVFGRLIGKRLKGEPVDQGDWCYYSLVVSYVCDGCEDLVSSQRLYDCHQDGAECVSGVCVLPDEALKSCVETDQGIDAGTKGEFTATNVVGVTTVDDDECTGSGQLREYYCDGDDLKQDIINCAATGKTCVDGECVP